MGLLVLRRETEYLCDAMELPQIFDLAVAWNWEYDRELIRLIQSEAHKNNVSVLEIRTETVEGNFNLLKNGKMQFRYLLDRASDEDDSFQPLARFVLKKFRSGNEPGMRPINPHDLQIQAADKATMHLEFLAHGIDVPYTIIISPYNHRTEVELSLTELEKLGRPFIIKPANTTGGGIGVVLGAETLKEVIEARQFHKNDKYLLQETIQPAELEGRRAWFRVFFAFGRIIPCWWNDISHVYSLLTAEEEQQLELGRIRAIVDRISSICQLEFFSTELVFTENGRCVAVDYVNEMCDMRLQSKYPDGVPDSLAQDIVSRMIGYVKNPQVG